MATEHLCKNHPTDPFSWQEGKATHCPHHRTIRREPGIRLGRKERRKLDRQAGVVGTDRGEFISGK